MTAETALPVGIEDFETIRRENLYYIDKTGLIKGILKNRAYVNLFTRPRRFGKTLNMSMLKCFFRLGCDRMDLQSLRKRNSVISTWESFRSFPSV